MYQIPSEKGIQLNQILVGLVNQIYEGDIYYVPVLG
jgi:hypothetical protein